MRSFFIKTQDKNRIQYRNDGTFNLYAIQTRNKFQATKAKLFANFWSLDLNCI